ncbi:MAG: ISL3 family transposase [Crocinitomicaceae bacterium]
MNACCSVQTFAEKLSSWLPTYARRTQKLTDVMYQMGLDVGAEASHRLLKYSQIGVSGDTILRILRRKQEHRVISPRIIGVDDWAFKRGKTYGTIIVDLEQHRVIDLLPDRTSETLAQWLRQYPQIEIVTRDRSTDYAVGIRQGAPQAIQVADRWHLLHNLRQMLQRYLTIYYSNLKQLPLTLEYEAVLAQQRPAYRRTQSERQASTVSRNQRIALYEKIQLLKKEGWKIAQLARELGYARITVRKYFNALTFPERKSRPQVSSILDPFIPYLETRLTQGCENASQLWREIQAQGFTGASGQVFRWMQVKRSNISPHTPNAYRDTVHTYVKQPKLPSSAQLSWLLVQNPVSMTENDQILLRFIQQDKTISSVYLLAQRFVDMVKNSQFDQLDQWIIDAQAFPAKPVQTFAKGIQNTYPEIRAALCLPWSNGQTEGQVNRLKFIKRQMYGRAKFDLLRLRVLG